MKPADFHDLGLRLMHDSTSAQVRTGVSRLYFASHLLAIDRASKGWSFEPSGEGADHGRLLRFMRDNRRLKALALQLERLREARGHADYHLDVSKGTLCRYCVNVQSGMRPDCEFANHDIMVIEQDAKELFSRLEKL